MKSSKPNGKKRMSSRKSKRGSKRISSRKSKRGSKRMSIKKSRRGSKRMSKRMSSRKSRRGSKRMVSRKSRRGSKRMASKKSRRGSKRMASRKSRRGSKRMSAKRAVIDKLIKDVIIDDYHEEDKDTLDKWKKILSKTKFEPEYIGAFWNPDYIKDYDKSSLFYAQLRARIQEVYKYGDVHRILSNGKFDNNTTE